MSDERVQAAERHVDDFRNRLQSSFGLIGVDDAVAGLLTAHIEGLILAHIQKTVANMMGRMP